MQPFQTLACDNTPVFNTTRLILRPLTIEDAEALFDLRGNPANFKYSDFTPYQSVERAKTFIERIQDDYQLNLVHFWAIADQKTNHLIGTICLWDYNPNAKSAEVGYEVITSYQLQGIASEALAEVIHFAFESCQLKQIIAVTHIKNQGSVALLNKFGFHLVGQVRELDPNSDEKPEMMLYTLLSQHAYSK